MTIAEKRQKALDNVPKVYMQGFSDGEKAENDRFWDYIQNYGKRTGWEKGFYNWGGEFLRPKYKIAPESASARSSTFQGCPNLKIVESKYFDFSKCPRGTADNQGWHYSFTTCSSLERVEDIGICNAYSFNHTWAWCGKLHTIECIYPDKDTKFKNAFDYCSSLVHIRFGDGCVIGQDINFQWSPLSVESAMSAMNALYYFDTAHGEYSMHTIYFSDATKALLDELGQFAFEFAPGEWIEGTWETAIAAKGWLAG